MKNYSPSDIEPKWQKKWEEQNLFKADESSKKPKRYILSMFPYPSGQLHMGHVMNYTISDVISRYSLMRGYSVLAPIGWDSFGLPAENAAIREGIHPSENIKLNITKMKEQMRSAGWGFDWDREISTSTEDYYKWTQWLFLKFYEAGLVEKKKAPVNWCPSCQTVLANEQVHDDKCERCGTSVTQKDLEQWFYLMSKYAQKLLDNHEKLDKWPDRVKKMQKEWIGRSEGASVKFKIEGSDESVEVFTTRPDTLFGVTFISMAPQHPMVEELIKDQPNKADILEEVNRLRMQGTSEMDLLTKEKEGVFTGRYVINPVNGDRVQLWIANFALMSYGTGIVMAVPAHDQRDFDFAKKYNLDIKVVIQPKDKELNPAQMTEAYTDDGLMVGSSVFTGRNNREAMHDIISWLDKNGYGKAKVNFRLRDWLLSRQRYWGAPIPVVYCDKCGTVPVPEEQLPVKLPKDVEFKPTGESPLLGCDSFMNTTCPKCGAPAKRDPDTMDTFVDSSWYYLRYCSPHEDSAPFSFDAVKHWAPVDIYIGGIEHATMHLIYVRFFALVMKDLGLIDFEEPADMLFCQGMVCKTAHYCDTCKWLHEDDVKDGKCLKCGGDVVSEVTKMSKTKLNTVSPEDIVNKYGADTMRLYILSDNPPDRDQVWNEDGVLGINRFLRRLWDTCEVAIEKVKNCNDLPQVRSKEDKELRRATHFALSRCTTAIESNWQFNTTIARIMELLNSFRKNSAKVNDSVVKESLEILLKLVAPMAPHMSEELWSLLGNKESIFTSEWPIVDESAMQVDEKTIVVQINGKLRDKFNVGINASKEELEKTALSLEKIKSYIDGKTIRKVIVVPGKLVNIVAN